MVLYSLTDFTDFYTLLCFYIYRAKFAASISTTFMAVRQHNGLLTAKKAPLTNFTQFVIS
jgi:hypothetical protein